MSTTTTTVRSRISKPDPSTTTLNTTSKRPSPSTTSASSTSKRPKTAKGQAAAHWRAYTGAHSSASASQKPISTSPADEASQIAAARARIAADASLTPFRRHVYGLLTQVPRGRWTTYKALSEAAAAASGQGGSARAVGGAMRSNPFAPAVPCHRVMAADRRIGGFKGGWGEEGEFAGEKERLLREEGVRFDEQRRVVGEPFVGFTS